MNYADLVRIRHVRSREDAFKISDAARLANEIQAGGEPSRTAALHEAERLQVKHGTGLVLASAETSNPITRGPVMNMPNQGGDRGDEMAAIRTYYGVGRRLRIMQDRSLRYWYEQSSGAHCEFSMLCEVGAVWQAGFERMVATLGLEIKHGADLDHAPWIADVVMNETLPEVHK